MPHAVRVGVAVAVVAALSLGAVYLKAVVWPTDPDQELRTENGKRVGEIVGYVVATDPVAGTVQVSWSVLGVGQIVFQTTPETAITINGKQGGVGDLWRDMPIRVSYELRDGVRYSRMIERVPAGGERKQPAVDDARIPAPASVPPPKPATAEPPKPPPATPAPAAAARVTPPQAAVAPAARSPQPATRAVEAAPAAARRPLTGELEPAGSVHSPATVPLPRPSASLDTPAVPASREPTNRASVAAKPSAPPRSDEKTLAVSETSSRALPKDDDLGGGEAAIDWLLKDRQAR